MKYLGTRDYIAAPELQDIVNVAIQLQKPLLIKGEPGTGKTLLAESIAEGLGLELLTWHVKSTSKAAEGLYTYDTVQRLNDSRFGEGDVSDIKKYIKLGALGRAFSSADRKVVLIDEIDKADMEFPNDLLHELDAMSFTIPETNETITAENRPILIITSNAEKELPDAFLRRCVFHFIEFPDESLMKNIIEVHHPNLEKKILSQCLVKFYWLREQSEIRKKPSTSELIDWIAAIVHGGITPKTIERELPFLGTLIKKEMDLAQINQSQKKFF